MYCLFKFSPGSCHLSHLNKAKTICLLPYHHLEFHSRRIQNRHIPTTSGRYPARAISLVGSASEPWPRNNRRTEWSFSLLITNGWHFCWRPTRLWSWTSRRWRPWPVKKVNPNFPPKSAPSTSPTTSAPSRSWWTGSGSIRPRAWSRRWTPSPARRSWPTCTRPRASRSWPTTGCGTATTPRGRSSRTTTSGSVTRILKRCSPTTRRRAPSSETTSRASSSPRACTA